MSKKQFLARIRSSSPLLFMVPGLVLGQIAAYVAPSPAYALALSAVLGLVAMLGHGKGRCRRWAILGGLILGILSACRVGEINRELSGDEGIYWMRVHSLPRHPSPGGISFGARLLGRVEPADGGTRLVVPFSKFPLVDCRAVDLPWRNISDIRRGDEAIMRAQVRPISGSAGIFSRPARLLRRGYLGECRIRYIGSPLRRAEPWTSKLRHAAKQQVREVLGAGETSGLALALSFGVRDGISEKTELQFKRLGLAHLLVLSGYQVALIFHSLVTALLLLFRCLGLLRIMRCMAYPAAFLLTLCFVAVVGFESSSVRAILAMGVLIISVTSERGFSLGNAIAVSFVILNLLSPACYLEPGVQLTFAALVGIWIGSTLPGPGLLRYVKVCWYATACTSLVGMVWFGNCPLMAPLANMCLAPLISIVGCEGVILGLLLYSGGIDWPGILLSLVGTSLKLMKEVVGVLAQWTLNDSWWATGLLCLVYVLSLARAARLIWRDFENRYGISAAGLTSPGSRDAQDSQVS